MAIATISRLLHSSPKVSREQKKKKLCARDSDHLSVLLQAVVIYVHTYIYVASTFVGISTTSVMILSSRGEPERLSGTLTY